MQQVKGYAPFDVEGGVDSMIGELKNSFSNWKCASWVFLVLTILGLLQQISQRQINVVGSIVALILWGCLLAACYNFEEAAETKQYNLVSKAISKLKVSVVIMWIYVILSVILAAFVFITLSQVKVNSQQKGVVYVTIGIMAFLIFIYSCMLYLITSLKNRTSALWDKLVASKLVSTTD